MEIVKDDIGFKMKRYRPDKSEKDNFLADCDLFSFPAEEEMGYVPEIRVKEKTETKNTEFFCAVRPAYAETEDIPGFLSDLKKVADESKTQIICLNEENIAGYRHIESAIFHARRSWSGKKSISKSFEMEVLLYAGGTRQCSRAGEFGLKKGKNLLYICICLEKELNNRKNSDKSKFSDDEEVKQIFEGVFDRLREILSFDDASIAKDSASEKFSGCSKSDDEIITREKMKRMMKLFEITKEEIETSGSERFSELVCERIALLDIVK